MKWQMNWGWKIALLYSGFVVMMLVLVGMSVSQKIDLVSEDYYAMELIHQQKIDKIRRAGALEEGVKWRLGEEFLEITFPENFDKNTVSGDIILYCPADNSKDRVIPIKLDSGTTQRIPRAGVRTGRYHLQVDWAVKDVTYWNEGVINI